MIRAKFVYTWFSRKLVLRLVSGVVALMACAVASAMTMQEAERVINAGQRACDRGEYANAISLLTRARNAAKAGGWQYLNYRAAYNLGVSYYYISDYSDALHYYNEAYNICMSGKLGVGEVNNVLNGIAGIYFNEGNWQKVEAMTKRCLQGSLKANDSTKIVTYLSNLTLLYNKLGRLDESKRALNEAKPYMKGCVNPLAIMTHKVVCAEFTHLSGDDDAVITLSKEIMGSKYAIAHDKTVVAGYLVDIYTRRGDKAHALQWAQVGGRIATTDSKPEFYDALSRLYMSIGDMRRALEYKDSVIAFKDSLAVIEGRKMLENEHVRFAVQQERNSMNAQLASVKSQRLVFFIIALICVVIVVVAVFVIRFMRLRNRQRQLIMDLRLEKEKNERILAEQQMRETELLSQYQKEKMKDALKAKEQEVQINSRLRSLLKNDTKLDEFMVQFEALYPNFVHNLQKRHPELTVSDVRFLAYIRMNLSNKEIASLLGITPDSSTRKKIRLSKRLGLQSSRDLYNYVAGI